MLTGQLRNDIDKLWEKFCTGGIANPLTVIEQISYLIFARMLDMHEETNERKAARTQKDYDRLFPSTPEGQLLRWKNFKNLSGKELHKHLKNGVYPYFASLGQHSEEKGPGSKGTTTDGGLTRSMAGYRQLWLKKKLTYCPELVDHYNSQKCRAVKSC
jgi:type I restriction enzyme M protein